MWNLILGLLVSFYIGSCSNDSGSSSAAAVATTTSVTDTTTTTSVTETTTTTTTTLTYAHDIAPILSSHCMTCHNGPDSSSHIDLSTYSSMMIFVTANDSANSVLYQQVNTNAMPLGGPALSAANKTKIQNWIDAGADE